MDSEFASDVIPSDRIFSSSGIYFLGLVLALRFFSQRLAQDFSAELTGFASGKFGGICDRRGGNFMQLKMFVLSGAAVALWLVPLVGLDKRIGWHKLVQGLSLGSAIACAVSAGSIARRLSDEAEIEAMKARAIKEDVEDEIAAEVYVSQKQRQQEAELILTSPGVDVEAGRQALEAMYDDDLQHSTLASTSKADASDLALWWKVSAAEVEGKSPTWIIENILNMKGRKFAEGKARLVELQKKFGEG